MKDKITSKKFAWALLLTAIIGGVGGALLLGDILHTVARIALRLSDESYFTIIIPLAILLVLGLIGTLALVLSVFVENKKMKIAIILFSILLPIVIEVIDLSIRTFAIISEVQKAYPVLNL